MWLQLFVTVGHACGVLALVAIACGQIVRLSLQPNVTSVIQGLAFASGVLFAMQSPVDVGAVSVDGRTVFIGLAAAFIGLPGALICALAVLIARSYTSEFPLVGEVVAVITPLCIGTLWSALLKRYLGTHFASLTVLALGISSTLLLYFLRYPPHVSLDIVRSCWLPIFTTAFVSAQVYGMLMARELAQLSREKTLAAEACVDPLTGIMNRRGFAERLQSVQFSGTKIALLMIDADKFKYINDTYGHPAGDAWLVAFVHLAQGVLPAGALLARLGGEEFAVILVNGDGVQSAHVAEELRREAESLKVTHLDQTFGTTISIGLAQNWSPTDSSLIQRADMALYFAKAAGRNAAAEVLRDGTPVRLDGMREHVGGPLAAIADIPGSQIVDCHQDLAVEDRSSVGKTETNAAHVAQR